MYFSLGLCVSIGQRRKAKMEKILLQCGKMLKSMWMVGGGRELLSQTLGCLVMCVWRGDMFDLLVFLSTPSIFSHVFVLLIMMRGWHGSGPALLTSLCNHALAARGMCWQHAFSASLAELHSWLQNRGRSKGDGERGRVKREDGKNGRKVGSREKASAGIRQRNG